MVTQPWLALTNTTRWKTSCIANTLSAVFNWFKVHYFATSVTIESTGYHFICIEKNCATVLEIDLYTMNNVLITKGKNIWVEYKTVFKKQQEILYQ